MKDPPRWNEDPQYWLQYKKALERWARTGIVPKKYHVARVAYNFRAEGICQRIVESLDAERLEWDEESTQGKRQEGHYWPLDPTTGRIKDEAWTTPPVFTPAVLATVDQPAEAERWDYPGTVKSSGLTTGLDYLIEEFSKQFEKSARNTFNHLFQKMFHLRRNGRHFAVWMSAFDKARSDLASDPIGKDLFQLPDFIWANWIYESAELTYLQRTTVETRMKDWRQVTEKEIRDLIRELTQPAEHPVTAGRGTSSRYAYDDADEEVYTDGRTQVYSAFHGRAFEYDNNEGLFLNNGMPDDPMYFVYWAEERDGAPFVLWGTQDGGDTWLQAEDAQQESEDQTYDSYKAYAPELSRAEASQAIWAVGEDDGEIECLAYATYPKGGGKGGSRPLHAKEGDGRGKKNADGLRCHRCDGDDHFSNHCPKFPFREKGNRKGKGKGKGARFRPPRREKGKAFGKGTGKGRPKGKGKGPPVHHAAYEEGDQYDLYYEHQYALQDYDEFEEDPDEANWAKRRPFGRGSGSRGARSGRGKGRGMRTGFGPPNARRTSRRRVGFLSDYGDDDFDPDYPEAAWTLHAHAANDAGHGGIPLAWFASGSYELVTSQNDEPDTTSFGNTAYAGPTTSFPAFPTMHLGLEDDSPGSESGSSGALEEKELRSGHDICVCGRCGPAGFGPPAGWGTGCQRKAEPGRRMCDQCPDLGICTCDCVDQGLADLPICNPPATTKPAYHTADGKPGPCSMCVANGRGGSDSDDGHDHGPIPDPGSKYIHTCKHVCPLCNPPAQCRCRACTFEDENGNVRGAPCLNTIRQGERFRYLCLECLAGHGTGPFYNTRPKNHRCFCRCRCDTEHRRQPKASQNKQGNEVSPPSRRGC